MFLRIILYTRPLMLLAYKIENKPRKNNFTTQAFLLFTVKEQCEALFPYKALNDDELSLNEGQIVNIISKEVEDKGWWRGESNGKIGVFPDNFVKIIEPKQEEVSEEEQYAKKYLCPCFILSLLTCKAKTFLFTSG